MITYLVCTGSGIFLVNRSIEWLLMPRLVTLARPQQPSYWLHEISVFKVHLNNLQCLTHWGRVMHIWISKLNIIGSDNGLSPDRLQAIIGTNAGILLIGALGTNFSDILIEIHTFSFKKMHLKVSSGKWRPFCLGLNVLSIKELHTI